MHDHRAPSFSVKQQVGNVGMFVLLKIENYLDIGISHFKFNSRHDRYKFALKLI